MADITTQSAVITSVHCLTPLVLQSDGQEITSSQRLKVSLLGLPA